MEKSMISLCLLGGLAIGNGFAQTPSEAIRAICHSVCFVVIRSRALEEIYFSSFYCAFLIQITICFHVFHSFSPCF